MVSVDNLLCLQKEYSSSSSLEGDIIIRESCIQLLGDRVLCHTVYIYMMYSLTVNICLYSVVVLQ